MPRLQTPQRRRRTSGLARSLMAESRGPEPHTSRCHRCSKPCRRACPVDSPRLGCRFFESSSNLSFCLSMISAQTRSAFVARETGAHFALTRPFGSGSCSRWRTAEALIPSAEAPTRFPIEAGGAPVHCPNGGVTADLHRNASRRPSVFKAAPARLSGSSSRAAPSAIAAGTAVSSFPLKSAGLPLVGHQNLATTIGLEPTSSTLGWSLSSS